MSDCELPEFYIHKEPIARKQHRCCECRSPILKGEKHFWATGKWNGEIGTFRQHLLCTEACELIRDEFNDHECIGFGELKDSISEMRWQYNRDKDKPKWKELRHLMAKILWRERKTKNEPTRNSPPT